MSGLETLVSDVGEGSGGSTEAKLGRQTARPHPGSLQIGAITGFCPLLGSFLSLIFPDLLRACLLAYSRSFKLKINIYQQTHSALSVASADRILGCKASPSGFGSMAFYLQPPAVCWKSLVCCHSDTGSLYDAISCLSLSLSPSLSLSKKFLEPSLCPSVLKIHNDETDLLVWVCFIHQNGRFPETWARMSTVLGTPL